MSTSSQAEIWRHAEAVRQLLRTALADNALVRRGARLTVLQETLSKGLKDVPAGDRTEVLNTLREMFPTELADPTARKPAPTTPPTDRSQPPAWAAGGAPSTISDRDPDPDLFAELVRGELMTFAAQMSLIVPGSTLKPGELTSLSEAAVGGDARSLDQLRRSLADLISRLKARTAGSADESRTGARRK